MENIYKCPKCGETELFQFTYDYSKAHRPVVNILCNNCGEQFPPISKLPKQKVMKNIHLIPTSQPSRLYLHSNGKIQIRTELSRCVGYLGNNQHIYITSSEEIKDRNCWVTNGKDVFKPLDDYSLEYANIYWQKIILTTDQDLINDGVQAIQDDFLEWFVNNPSCQFVEVVKEMYMPQSNGKISDGKITHELSLNPSDNTLPFYKIIIPKEEPKDVVLEYKTSLDAQMLDKIELEGTMNLCNDITEKRTGKMTEEEWQAAEKAQTRTKQETLEEAAKEYDKNSTRWGAKNIFIDGAKWQQERMYSEEEVIAFTQWMYDYKGDINKVEELLKQFKNEK
jgi:hypothetical protein